MFCNIEDVLSLLLLLPPLLIFASLLFDVCVVVFNKVLFVVVFTKLLLFELDIFELNVEFVLLHKINELLLLALLLVLFVLALVVLALLKPFRLILDEVPGVNVELFGFVSLLYELKDAT